MQLLNSWYQWKPTGDHALGAGDLATDDQLSSSVDSSWDELEQLPIDFSKYLLPEENEIEQMSDMVYFHLKERIYGQLALTNYRLLFVPRRRLCPLILSVPLGTLASIDVRYNLLVIRSKLPRGSLRFSWLPSANCDVTSSSVYMATPASFLVAFKTRIEDELRTPFVLKCACAAERPLDARECAGFSMERELARQGTAPGDWRLVNNSAFDVCPTYPAYFGVPAGISDEVLREAAQFRSQNRVIALTYYHEGSGAAIVRSSQPMVGITRARSDADERLVNRVRRSARGNKSGAILLVDARAKINAWANTALKGAGTEIEANYAQGQLVHLNIPNIHAIRASQELLFAHFQACVEQQTTSGWGAGIDGSGWLTHLHTLLKGAAGIAQSVMDGTSALVHCSDGWDRTSQLCALAQLMLDPFFRTITGFQHLIEKDFLAFGHKFADRSCVRKLGFWSDHESAPIFAQFIDAVWQLMHQQPQAFEFNEDYLICIADHAYTARFSTFLGNCARDRVQYADMPTLWSWLEERRDYFVNASFQPVDTPMLVETVTPPALWNRFYLRFYQRVSLDTELVHDRHSVPFEDAQSLLGNPEPVGECHKRIDHEAMPGVKILDDYDAGEQLDTIELQKSCLEEFNLRGTSYVHPSHVNTQQGYTAQISDFIIKMLI